MQLRLVGGDREDIRVLREGLLVSQRVQRITELLLIRAHSTHLLKRNGAVIALVEILEGIAETHQVVLPQSPPVFDPTLFRW